MKITNLARGCAIAVVLIMAASLRLQSQEPPGSPPGAGGRAGRGAAGAPSQGARGGGGLGPGAGDKHAVDPAAAERGKSTYIAECITCHGPKTHGTDRGADLIRSVTVLHDRYGDTLAPFLQKGHPLQSGNASARLPESKVQDLAHFLHQSVNETLNRGPRGPVNVLTGDPKAGAEYFNGAGRCSTCHSPTGDLAGIARKYDPVTLQQRFLFPRAGGFGRGRGAQSGKPVMVTVKPPNGPAVSGVLNRLDDFSVSLRDSDGEYHSWKRTPDLQVEKNDPYAAHYELLEKYTDKNIHDVVTYLGTLK